MESDEEQLKRMQVNDASDPNEGSILNELEQDPIDKTRFGPLVLLKLFSRGLRDSNQNKTLHQLVILTQLSKISGRDLLETLGAQQQCRAAGLGAPPNNKISAEKCWLCGLAMNDFPQSSPTPECEHLIPVSAALVYYGVYKSQKANAQGIDYKSNYKWAHSKCNRIKDDLVFLNFFSQDDKLLPAKNVTINEKYIEDFLNTLSQNDQIKVILRNKRYDPYSWMRDRIKSIKNDLNDLLPGITNRGDFSFLTGVAEIIDNIDDLYATLKVKLNNDPNGTLYIRSEDKNKLLNKELLKLLNDQEKYYENKTDETSKQKVTLNFSKEAVNKFNAAKGLLQIYQQNTSSGFFGGKRSKTNRKQKKSKRIQKMKTLKRKYKNKHV